MLYQNCEKWEGFQRQQGAADHNAVSKQPKMKMIPTVKAYPKVMMLHQIGRKSRWCQQKSKEIKECCWHQGKILPRWYSIFSRLPSHHHEKASIWYSMGMPGTENHLHCLADAAWIYECSHVDKGWYRFFHKFALFESYAIILFHNFLTWRVYDIKSRHSRPVKSEWNPDFWRKTAYFRGSDFISSLLFFCKPQAEPVSSPHT